MSVDFGVELSLPLARLKRDGTAFGETRRLVAERRDPEALPRSMSPASRGRPMQARTVIP